MLNLLASARDLLYPLQEMSIVRDEGIEPGADEELYKLESAAQKAYRIITQFIADYGYKSTQDFPRNVDLLVRFSTNNTEVAIARFFTLNEGWYIKNYSANGDWIWQRLTRAPKYWAYLPSSIGVVHDRM